MRNVLLLTLLLTVSLRAYTQGIEVAGISEGPHRGYIGETVKAPIRLRNTTDKALTVVIRRVHSQIGSTQRNFFCLDGNCQDEKLDDILVKLEPGQTLSTVQIALEGGLISEQSHIRFIAFPRTNPSQQVEFEVNFSIEEKPSRNNVYQSRFFTVKDIYPNPCVDHSFVDYSLESDRVKAKLRIHNILGNVMGEYDLQPSETLLRVKTDDFTAGIYFYTLYLDNESVVTRKIIVKK